MSCPYYLMYSVTIIMTPHCPLQKQREEAAAKRAEESAQKEALKQTKTADTAKALGKK